ncbi:hypothetical protein [Mesorhizobium sp. CAU 1741]|uniref:hypothetical protein n=1 Tax=Mesorhizobium sp. CAU 1741 TaxID=3140366 RepID=UPI00325BD1E2
MSIFNPDFELRMKARQQADAVLVDARPRQPAPKPLHVAFRGPTADALRRVADARQESPQALAAAIVERALRNGTAEEGLGEARAEQLAGGQGRRPFGEACDLTLKQCAVIYLVGSHGGAKGWCGWSAAALARLMPDTVDGGNVVDVLAALARRGLVERARQAGRAPRPCRLTELGFAVYAQLAGEFDDG